MQLGRYSVSTLRPASIHSIRFTTDGRHFAVASETGYEVWRTWPLALMKRKTLPGTLALVLPLPASPLLVLQGGGSNPLYPPNKAVIYNDKIGLAIAELEFGERIKGIDARHGLLCIALSRRVVAFEYGIDGPRSRSSGNHPSKGKGKEESHGGFWLSKYGEWETALNENGLIALATAPSSTLLALPGRQPGHVQLIPLPPCPGGIQSSISRPPTFRTPIILAHTHPLSALTCSTNGSHLITASERGTLLRVWETNRGNLEQELRRGVDRAEMWGASFENPVVNPSTGSTGAASVRSSKGKVVGWSDKGTVHVWASDAESKAPPSSGPSLGRIISQNLPLPKYFSSTASAAQYHLPQKNPHAFANAVGAVAGKAGVHSRKLEEDDGEWSERFVVGWVDVQVEDKPIAGDVDHSRDYSVTQGDSIRVGMGNREERRSFGSETNSSRTATPTPTSALRGTTNVKGGGGPGAKTPPIGVYRRSSALSTYTDSTSARTLNRGITSSSVPSGPGGSGRPRVNTTTAKMDGRSKQRDGVSKKDNTSNTSITKTKIERQLVAITYSGDWYRLRIPDGTSQTSGSISGSGTGGQEGSEGAEGRKRKCELVEYRRLGVGGGGW